MIDRRQKQFMGFIFLSICFAVFILRVTSTRSKLEEIYSEFPLLIKEDSLNNYVSEKHVFKGFKYTPTMVFLTLDNQRVCRIYSSLNPEYSNKGINDILERGDKLLKETGNDTIYVVKKASPKARSYYFLLKPSKAVL